ncbi:MAG: F0F1 ATP synthase subunit epsilon [Muribaculaceae bacterium]|nr:F0F1 ATP synthase subunit epsilon [Muribaculaceae bacterium]MBP5314918.1 F0F1 ATP synthase subunit epsilon [Muribaculaceae bacterium]MBR4722331.1 F0F1 ATP synthase subunit epsilon [Muribaculaceae bacterium]
MTLRIISSTDTLFDGEVTSVTLPGAKGSFMVLQNHASLVSTLVAGKIVYVVDDAPVEIEVSGGLVDVDNNVVSVCIF